MKPRFLEQSVAYLPVATKAGRGAAANNQLRSVVGFTELRA
jgi:hypothetical protein